MYYVIFIKMYENILYVVFNFKNISLLVPILETINVLI